MNLCWIPSPAQASRNCLERNAEPLSVSRRLMLSPRAGVIGRRGLQEGHGAAVSLVGVHFGEAHASVIVDGDEQELPTGTHDPIASIVSDAVVGTLDASELFSVDMQQISGSRMLVAPDRFSHYRLAQAREPSAARHTVDRALGQTQAGCDALLGESPATQLDDRQRSDGSLGGCGAGANWRPPVPPGPGPGSDPATCACLARSPLPRPPPRRGELQIDDLHDHPKSMSTGQSGIFVVVHSAAPFEITGGSAISSVSNPVRMDPPSNLMNLHI